MSLERRITFGPYRPFGMCHARLCYRPASRCFLSIGELWFSPGIGLCDLHRANSELGMARMLRRSLWRTCLILAGLVFGYITAASADFILSDPPDETHGGYR